MTSMPPKFKPKLIQQHHKLPTMPKFHKPPTLSRLHRDQKMQHFKNAPKPTLQHDQSYNAPNSNKITQQHNDNALTSNFQFQISNCKFQTLNFSKSGTIFFQIISYMLKHHRIDNSSPIPCRIDNISPTFKGSTLVLPKLIGSTIVLLCLVGLKVALLPSRDRP